MRFSLFPTISPTEFVPILLIIRGSDEGIIHVLDRDETVLGNSPNADAQLNDSHLPEEFLRLTIVQGEENTPPKCELVSLDPSIDITVNNEPTIKKTIVVGDIISIGLRLQIMYAYEPYQLIRFYRKYYEQSIYDDLTKVYNRRYFILALQKEIAFAGRQNYKVGLAMIDIDQLKQVNDQYGHVVGDEVIRKVANIFASGMRQEDILGRLGGDEFAIILRGVDPHSLNVILERIRKNIESTGLELKDGKLTCTVSIGATYIDNKNDKDYKAVLDRADKQQYLAKENGRNCIHVG